MIFFCDVDLVFDANLVNRIRFFVQKNEVYFPIFFSQYELVPSGFWRTFSYGMVAFQYDDFLRTGGFDLEKVLVQDMQQITGYHMRLSYAVQDIVCGYAYRLYDIDYII